MRKGPMVPSTRFAGPSRLPRPAPHCRPARLSVPTSQSLHDAELVRRFNSGDASAFVEIIARYRVKMHSIALSVLRNAADAEEIAQDTFLRAHRGLGRFRGDSTLATWLHRIALNLSRNRYWYFFRRARRTSLSIDSDVGDERGAALGYLLCSPAPSPAQTVAMSEFADLVDVCMAQLPPNQREILTRRNVLHCSYHEIAIALKISVSAVKSRIARARSTLRALMAASYPEFDAGATPAAWLAPDRFGLATL
jgi:RNA polymerase sigma-70 factor, ECF subfamily